jgi:hypothetical protein
MASSVRTTTDCWADAVVVAAVQTGWLSNPLYARSRSSHIAMWGCKCAQRFQTFVGLLLGTDVQVRSMSVWTCCGLWLQVGVMNMRHYYIHVLSYIVSIKLLLYVGAQGSLAKQQQQVSSEADFTTRACARACACTALTV